MLLEEPMRERIAQALGDDADPVMSAATLTEALIVAQGHKVRSALDKLIGSLEPRIHAVTHARALAAADAYSRWGKGVHRARLNYGDCFAYALARELDCPLLYVGDDFARTDVASALG